MKTEGVKKMWLYRVLKKLWGYIRKEKIRVIIFMNVKVDCEVKENHSGKVDIEVLCISKEVLVDSIAVTAKLTKADAGRALDATLESIKRLKDFKATEPEL